VVSHVYRPRDLYHGPYSRHAPDLLPSWWEDGFLLEQSTPGGALGTGVERSSSPIQGGVEFAGSHRLDGVFMIQGGPICRNFTFEDASIVDVAPTVLYLMGVPVPDDMDGRVLAECIDEKYLRANPIQSESAKTSSAPLEENPTSFTSDESELIARRLQALGYIK
jgi:predicted AlkP superfamily phosphohydrolase/phosphomutase